MTERVHIEHTFECSEATFWELFLDDDFNIAMFKDYLKFPRWEVVESQDSETELKRVVEVEPYVADLPAAMKKVVGDRVRYREEGRLDKAKGRYFVKVIPGTMAEKTQINCEQYTESLGEGRCKRVFDATIEVKVFGVGGLIEKRIASDLTRSYDLGAKYTSRTIREKGLS